MTKMALHLSPDHDSMYPKDDPNGDFVIEYMESLRDGTVDPLQEAARAAELVQDMLKNGMAQRHKFYFDRLVAQAENRKPLPPMDGLPFPRRD